MRERRVRADSAGIRRTIQHEPIRPWGRIRSIAPPRADPIKPPSTTCGNGRSIQWNPIQTSASPFRPLKVVADTHRLLQGRPSGREVALVKQANYNGTEIPFTSNHSADAGRG
ncbi:hypothetical protein GCM10010149_21380 [Nonomuraea roseoviolacea subsp. roseoviolacea]